MSQLEAIVFDWAGTLVDFGSCAPRKAFVQLFEKYDVKISETEASGPMGLEKREHIVQLLKHPRIAEAWLAAQNKIADDTVIDAMYQQLIPLQIEQIGLHSKLVPGVLEMLEAIADRGLLYGTTTGYNREMIEEMVNRAAEQGFRPDCVVAANEVPSGRPGPAALLKNLIELQVSSVKRCVKVDDTAPGIAEGINANVWTVAVVLSGNALGMPPSQWQALNNDEKITHKQQAYRKLEGAGAHYYIDSVQDLPPVLTDIECRLSRGEKP